MRTVPINEAEYCQGCPNFTPVLKTATYYVDNNVYTQINEIVCENSEICRHLYKRLRGTEGGKHDN